MNVKTVLLTMACVAASFFSVNTIAKPQRVVSLNLCADQILMTLLTPERLVGITHLSLDEGISYHHEKAKHYTPHHGRIEEIIALQPDLIIAGQFTTQTTNQLLEKLGYRVIRIGLPKTVLEIKKQVTALGAYVGAPKHAASIVEEMESALNQLAMTRIQGQPRAAIYYANGFSAGKQTIVDEAMRYSGFSNIAAEQGLNFIAPLSMESLIIAEPEVLILGRYQEGANSMAHQILQHTALQRYIYSSQAVSITMPDRYWDCAGPSFVAAIERLQIGYRQHKPDRGGVQ